MAKIIMVQGTMSNAGKSLLSTALCRIFRQDGYSVAPFKSQNMALNSFVTTEGLEMGRAQVVQAEACGILPSVQMNPVLLKPTTDVGSQIIVNGEVIGNMTAAQYHSYKPQLFSTVLRAFHQLCDKYDVVVIEGAGSPAEINLRQNDIVNMGFATSVGAPVLLVGDIDRGGVFAQLMGTIALLPPEERRLIKALVINKFRGDVTLLQPGLDMLSHQLQPYGDFPFAGVVPYCNVDIDDEDSLSTRLCKSKIPKAIDIAVIRLPKISNFTDFTAFERFENVSLRYISSVSELGQPDMILLPGTKSTISDLLWLRESGLSTAILKASNSAIVFGICGGYQMLGRQLLDPLGVESGGAVNGLSLLPISTIYGEKKTRTQTQGTICNLTGALSALNGLEYAGYEIHMGASGSHSAVINCGNVYGTYVHGIFDSGDIANTIIQILCQRKGISFDKLSHFDLSEYKEQQYQKLADTVRASLDMELIYQILKESV